MLFLQPLHLFLFILEIGSFRVTLLEAFRTCFFDSCDSAYHDDGKIIPNGNPWPFGVTIPLLCLLAMMHVYWAFLVFF